MKKTQTLPAPVSDRELCAVRAVLAVSLLLTGLSNEFFAALASAALLLWLWRRKSLSFRLNLPFLAVCALFLGYGLSCFWAVDRGLAPLGLAKMAPLPLAALCLMQLGESQRSRCLDDLPTMAALLTLLSYPLQFVPVLSAYFCVSGRLAGFFQYPNSFAILLLLALERLFLEAETRRRAWQRVFCAALTAFGLIQTGSRAVFVLALLFFTGLLAVRLRQRRLREILPPLGGALLGLVFCVPAAQLSASSLQHLGELSPGASTLLGRVLYAKDALPVILRHPGGLGYLGYYMSQGSFQHGVYAVRWVHNDLLQIFLDVGWLPALLAIAAAFASLRAKRGGAARRVPLLTLLAHCLFDFDLEFGSLFIVLLLLLDWESGQERRFRPQLPLRLIAGFCAAAFLYLGTAVALAEDIQPSLGLRLYPRHTLALTNTLPALPDLEAMDTRADQILSLDRNVALAWDAKALCAYQKGDFERFILAKREALRCAPYSQAEYDDAIEKLSVGEALYLQAGDSASAAVCRQEMQSIAARMREVLDSTDPLAWRLADKPALSLPKG